MRLSPNIVSLLYGFTPVLTGVIFNLYAMKLGDSFVVFFSFQVFLQLSFSVSLGAIRHFSNSNKFDFERESVRSRQIFILLMAVLLAFFYGSELYSLLVVFALKKLNDLKHEFNSIKAVNEHQIGIINLVLDVIICISFLIFDKYFVLIAAIIWAIYNNKDIFSKVYFNDFGLIRRIYSLLNLSTRFYVVVFLSEKIIDSFGKFVVIALAASVVVTIFEKITSNYVVLSCLIVIGSCTCVFFAPYFYSILGINLETTISFQLIMVSFIVFVLLLQIQNKEAGLNIGYFLIHILFFAIILLFDISNPLLIALIPLSQLVFFKTYAYNRAKDSI